MFKVSRFRSVIAVAASVVAASVVAGGLVISVPASAGTRRQASGPTWSASTPGVPGASITSLAGVTCLTTSDCWAVGDRFKTSSSSTGPALIEHFVGGRWVPVAAARAQKGTLDELSAVSCLSSADCWAVGMRSGAHPGNLLEHYAGSGGWRAVGTPAPQGELAAVSCEPAEDQCWAAGSSRDFRAAITFHLVGGRWHYVKPATVSASFVQVNGLGCESVDDCLLVGFITPKHGAGSALAERWNGHAWSRLAVGGERAGGGSLAGVGCPQAGSRPACWVVGQTVGKGSGIIPIHPLVERWNGSSLTLVDSPSGGPGDYPELMAVACANQTACQTVGSRGSGEDNAMVLTEGWDGSAWMREPSPSPLYGFRTLSGVACPSPKDCWAVGEGLIRSGEGTRMVIEHF